MLGGMQTEGDAVEGSEGVDGERMLVFGNPAPDEFYVDQPERRGSLRRILVVSNHVPPELLEALDLLQRGDEQIEVEYLGAVSGRETVQKIAEPSDFDGFDAVVTIGKTVQYALVRGVPVFCYDRFGGPGWLSAENFAEARAANFSGRGFGSLTSAEIVEALTRGFAGAAECALALHARYAREFLLSEALDRLGRSGQGIHSARAISDDQLAAYLVNQKVMNGLVNTVEARTQTNAFLEGQVRVETARVQSLTEQNEVAASQLDASASQNAELEQQLAETTAELASRAAENEQLAARLPRARLGRLARRLWPWRRHRPTLESIMSNFNDQIIAEFRANNGTVTTAGFGSSLVLLHSLGVKSGIERVTPVMSIARPDGTWLIAASKAGAPENPAWYANLKAKPETSIETGSDTVPVVAEELTDPEYDAGWAEFTSRAPGFADYQVKAGSRRIPVIKLSPR
ncbi:hypothetical protein GCM10011399_27740 [Subtercola lobariae]|uniref:Nitroreductase family deazaflavin-dependent oxidoreductase n=2 Tax=Subtercola lobariae TaxID=1588641 RepID=A0A917B9J6_9MICO|nr:hypothetical protein GCM10011399_27740 [Subtercola lobariae]